MKDTKKMRKTIKASHRDIVDYWEIREGDTGFGVDWAEAHEHCWRCGYKSQLERCHIVPDSLGGSNDPSNLVLLCRRCHREAPNVSDPRFMWIWIRATSVPMYATYWIIRGHFEFEQMFGRLPFDEIALSEEEQQLFEELFREELQQTIIHFGEGMINPSTIACIFAKVEEKFTGKLPALRSQKWGYEYSLKSMGIKTNPHTHLNENNL
jgi:ribosomal protein L37E